MDGDRKFFDLIFAVDFGLGFAILQKRFLFVFVDISGCDRVKVASFPVFLGGFGLQDVVVHVHFFIMVLQVSVSNHIIVSLFGHFNLLAANAILFCGVGSFTGRLEVMLGLVYIANDVEIANSVLAGAIVPSFFFGVVWSILKPLQLVLEVQNVVGLFVPKRFVLLTSKQMD